jgi:hypothetical protein
MSVQPQYAAIPLVGFGQISVANTNRDGTGMKLTTAYYHTPSGRLIQGKGVMPDVVAEDKPIGDALVGPRVRPVALERPGDDAAARQAAALCARASRDHRADAPAEADDRRAGEVRRRDQGRPARRVPLVYRACRSNDSPGACG